MASRLWSKDTNKTTGERFEFFKRYLNQAHNGEANIDELINSPYGDEWAHRLNINYMADDSMGNEVLEYYKALGIKKEMFETDSYFTRWALFTPEYIYCADNANKKYPLVFVHHGGGNSLESEEFSTGLVKMCADEGFIAAVLQNTNWDNVQRIYNKLIQDYPVDTERVYVTGYSQGGMKTTECMLNCPQLFAAAGPSGNSVWETYLTEENARYLKQNYMPVIQMVGRYEGNNMIPYNKFTPPKDWGVHLPGDPLAQKYRPQTGDPTQTGPMPNFKLVETNEQKLSRINNRLYTMGCRARDVEESLNITQEKDGIVSKVFGFKGDREEVKTVLGVKHFVSDCFNDEGMLSLRLVAVDNAPHWPPVTMGSITWEFFKQYKRDSKTGKIVKDEYKKP